MKYKAGSWLGALLKMSILPTLYGGSFLYNLKRSERASDPGLSAVDKLEKMTSDERKKWRNREAPKTVMSPSAFPDALQRGMGYVSGDHIEPEYLKKV